jgi:hypothetical protein
MFGFFSFMDQSFWFHLFETAQEGFSPGAREKPRQRERDSLEYLRAVTLDGFHSLETANENSVVPCGVEGSEKFVPDFLAPAGHGSFGVIVTGLNFQDFVYAHAANTLFGFQKGPGTGHGTSINDFGGFNVGQVFTHEVSPSTNRLG